MGGRGAPNFSFIVESYFFRTIGEPFSEKKKLGQKVRKKKETNFYDHYTLPAMRKGSTHTSLGPIKK